VEETLEAQNRQQHRKLWDQNNRRVLHIEERTLVSA
jgi:hypothetical protein